MGLPTNLTPAQKAEITGSTPSERQAKLNKLLGTVAPAKAAPAPSAALGRVIGQTSRSRPSYVTPKDPPADPTETRFGNDMAWLDPSFQRTASLAHSDRGNVDAQQAALDQLTGIAKGGGATAMERDRRAQARLGEDQWINSQRDADMQSLGQRGMRGSGAEVATMLGDRQAAGSRLAQAGLDTDASLEQRALDAMTGSGNLATSMRNESDNINQTNAAAINSANADNKAYLQNAQQATLQQRWAAQQNQLGRNTQIAAGLMGFDAGQNAAGFSQGDTLAVNDANNFNNAKQNVNNLVVDPNANGANAVLGGQNAAAAANAAATGAYGGAAAGVGNDLAALAAGGATGGAVTGATGSAAAGGAASGAVTSQVAGNKARASTGASGPTMTYGATTPAKKLPWED